MRTYTIRDFIVNDVARQAVTVLSFHAKQVIKEGSPYPLINTKMFWRGAVAHQIIQDNPVLKTLQIFV
jgi:hypothetical protein